MKNENQKRFGRANNTHAHKHAHSVKEKILILLSCQKLMKKRTLIDAGVVNEKY